VSWQPIWVHGVHLFKKETIASSDLRYGIRPTTSPCLAIYAIVAAGDESAMNLRSRTSFFELSCCVLGANFYEKALFVKSRRGGLSVANATLCPSRYASIRTLGELTLFGGSVHYEIRPFELEALQSSERPSSWRVGQVHMAQSPHARSEAHSGTKSRGHLPL
jgi:hypothetical protein